MRISGARHLREPIARNAPSWTRTHGLALRLFSLRGITASPREHASTNRKVGEVTESAKFQCSSGPARVFYPTAGPPRLGWGQELSALKYSKRESYTIYSVKSPCIACWSS